MELRGLHGHGGHGAQNSSKMKKYLAEKQKQEQKMAQTPCFPTQSLRTSASPSSPTISLLESIDHIRISAFYEIDHSKLPPRNTPEHFKSVRVVMVSEKGPPKVTVRFPSIQSLQNHVFEKGYQKPQAKLIPALTEKYTMAPEMASEVLYRRITPQEIADKGNVWSFWAVRPPPATNLRRSSWASPVDSKKGRCWSELKFTGMVNWGKRRKVFYLRRHESPPSSGDEAEKGKEIMELEEFGNCVYVDDDDEKTEDDEEEAPPPPSPPKKVNLRKRKLKVTPQKKKSKAKGAKRQKQKQIVAVPKQSDKQLVKVNKNAISRWSAERYKLAEENMLKVMKDKNATVENPMLRPALRVEAKKLIGDTGLLDHLLKHMAGKVAPGGAERFMRRNNADGAMEYWLEIADLVDIRKESGVEDPFWIPPPGWKLGDNPTQHPTCARQINELKEEIVQPRREMQETKQNQEDLAMVTTSSPCVTCLGWDQSSLAQLQDLYAELSVKKAKLEENLMEASQNLSGMEVISGHHLRARSRHGTTVVAMFLKSSIIIGADSRVTKEDQEGATVIEEDDAEKIKIFSLGLVAAYSGDVDLWDSACEFIDKWVKNKNNAPLDMAKLASEVYKHLKPIELGKHNEGIDLILARCEEGCPRIYLVVKNPPKEDGRQRAEYLHKDSDREIPQKEEIVSLGGGAGYAKSYIISRNKLPTKQNEVIDLLQKGIVFAALNDECTGGRIQMFHVNASNPRKLEYHETVLEIYIKNVEKIEKEPGTLIVLQSTVHDFTTLKISNHFRKSCSQNSLRYAHILGMLGNMYVVHRLVFSSEAEAHKALDKVPKLDCKDQVEGMQCTKINPGVHVYVNFPTKDLLEQLLHKYKIS